MAKIPNCAMCNIKKNERACKNPDGKSPTNCPTEISTHIISDAMKYYSIPYVYEFARNASIQETQGYGDKELGYNKARPVKTRIQEIIEFAYKMNYKRLGLAFCSGLIKEAGIVGRLLVKYNFEVSSVVCKVGCVPKEDIGLKEEEKNCPFHFESMCNPIMQALVLNESHTELNVLLGLCVGHDSLFLQYSKAPCTILAVKDRLLGHNPLAAIYNIHHYYRHLDP